jgi:long-chain acyl-CoA synthetase
VVSEDDDELLIENAGEGGDVGPIAIRGVTLFSGYWPDGHGGPAPDGWFRTGDLGYLDDAGELHLVDRVAETVTIAGFTVYPREVEDVLVSHPYVADAAVVGVPGPGGPAVVAALVAHRGTRPTRDDLDEFLADRLPPFKRPTDYQLVDVLPRTEVGRLDRVTVRRNYARYRGISLDQQVRQGPAARVRDAGGPVVQAVPGTAPEAAAGLDRLGIKLPAADSRTRRSAQDTDEDLF